MLWSDLVVPSPGKIRGQLGLITPKGLVVYEATVAKSATSQRDGAERQNM